MKVAIFNAKQYDKDYFTVANAHIKHELTFLEPRLSEQTIKLVEGHGAVCIFTNDIVNQPVIEELFKQKVSLIALRCAGYNNVDLEACDKHTISVVRVPAYSPYAVAEHTLALVMALNRKMTETRKRYHLKVECEDNSISWNRGKCFAGGVWVNSVVAA